MRVVVARVMRPAAGERAAWDGSQQAGDDDEY
jgi:hypothetical protein